MFKLQVILNRAKHVNSNLSQIDSGVSDHKMTWTHDKMHLAESVDDSRMKFQRNSSKLNEKFDLFKKLHELYVELNRDESSQANYVCIIWYLMVHVSCYVGCKLKSIIYNFWLNNASRNVTHTGSEW